MPELKIKRITIDIDASCLRDAIHYAENETIPTLMSYDFERLTVKQSSSERGLHIIAWHDVGFWKEELLRIRAEAGDDYMRINLDKRPHRHKQVLFDQKKRVKKCMRC